MSKALRQPTALSEKCNAGFFDDFLWYISPHLWTTTGDTNNTATITANAVGGVLALTTVNTDNDQVMVATTNATFKFQAGANIVYEARVQYAEANTDDANVAIGFSSDFTTDLLLDNGGGPDTNHSGALIYKVDGGTAWLCQTSKGTTQSSTTSTTTAGGADYHTFRIEARDVDGSNVEVTFFYDDQPLRDSNNKAIKHTVAFSSALAMKPGVLVKAGGANVETVSIDYITCWQNSRA